jgi:hypothetical protein
MGFACTYPSFYLRNGLPRRAIVDPGPSPHRDETSWPTSS